MTSTSAFITAGLTLVFAFWFWQGYIFGSDLADKSKRDRSQIEHQQR